MHHFFELIFTAAQVEKWRKKNIDLAYRDQNYTGQSRNFQHFSFFCVLFILFFLQLK
jgi:hypothetical protein